MIDKFRAFNNNLNDNNFGFNKSISKFDNDKIL